MSRTIKERQNDSDILDLQFSARYHMSKASRYNSYIFCLILFILFIQCLLIYGIVYKNEKNILLISINFLCNLLLFLFNFMPKPSIEIGSITKEYVDCELFNINFSYIGNIENTDIDKLKEKKILAINKSNPTYYNKQISNSGNSPARGLKDWYNLNDDDNGENAILKCQDQNNFWSNRLVIDYRRLLYVILIISFTLFLIPIFLIVDKEIYHFTSIFEIIPTLSLVWYIIDQINKTNDYYIQTIKIDTLISTKDNCIDKKKLIIVIQKEIFKKRNLIIVPDFLHKFANSNLHQFWSSRNNSTS